MNSLVVANPGTGKTTQISNEIVNLLKKGVKPEDILCITFTNNAVKEMQIKIDKALKNNNVLNVTAYDIKIMTFHGFAYEQLDDYESDIISYNLIRYLVYKKLTELKAFHYSREYVINEIIPKIENAIRYIKSFGITPDDILKSNDAIKNNIRKMHSSRNIRNLDIDEELYLFDYFYEAYDYYEKNKKNYDFNDLLFEYYKKENKIKYDYIFVDELQDVNQIEAKIAMSSGVNKYFVGDKKQSIFGFQGGALSVFKELLKDKNFKREVLDQNYRSTERILDYSREFYRKYDGESDELKNFHGQGKDGETVKIFISEEPESAIISILNKINNNDKQIGIIARTNDQVDKISNLLDNYNITYSSDSNIHTTNEAKKDVINFLKGLFYDDTDNIMPAIFSPFSGISLKNAFEISETLKEKESIIDQYGENDPFFKLKNKKFNKETIYKIFDERILPVAVSINEEYFLTAATIKSSLKDFFDLNSDFTRKEFFDYLDLSYSENYEAGKESKIVLTTVHKAKGKEFDTVIYVPKKTRKTDSYIDIITTSIINIVRNIDVENELENEDIRINFVAFTRAKNNLNIVTKQKEADFYYVPGHSEKEIIENISLPLPKKSIYNEAYFQFVAGNYDKVNDILTQNNTGLRDLIHNFFKTKNVWSFSLINLTENPFWLMKNYILKLNEKTAALYYGLGAHELAEMIYKNELKKEILREEQTVLVSNIEEVNNQIKKTYNAEQIGSEISAIAKINEMFPEFKNADDSLMFFGKLDAVFSNGDEYIILDYKTDKKTNNTSHHRVQLLSYKILYSIKNNIDISKIHIALGYISLRGNINTHKTANGIVYKDPDVYSEKKLKEYISKFIEYRNNPDQFIDDFKKYNCEDTLFKRLASIL